MNRGATFFKPLLPIPNLAMAYSFRRVNPNYFGAAIRVRRSSDSAEQDIFYLGGGELDTVSLLNFVGAGDGWIVNWYNQGYSGSSAQIASGNGMKIVVAGVIPTLNGKPCTVHDTGYYGWGGVVHPQVNRTMLWVGKYDIGKINPFYQVGSSGRFYFRPTASGLNFRLDLLQAIFTNIGAIDYVNQTISAYGYQLDNNMRLDYQGTDYGTLGFTSGNRTSAHFGTSDTNYQEILFYDINFGTDLGGLCDDINNYYGAY